MPTAASTSASPIDIDPALLATLYDIASKVELQSDFRIVHPDYQPFELSPEIVASLRKLPHDIQQRYACLQLRGFLYGIYYNGHLLPSLALDAVKKQLPTDLENSTFLGVDQDFLAQLHHNNSGSGYFDMGWSVLRETEDNSLLVQKGDLKVRIERDRHLQSMHQAATPGEEVAILMPKNLIQKGFYLAVGNAGSPGQPSVQTTQPTVRIYFNLLPEGAVVLMKDLTTQLNHGYIPFIFKVLYNPADYHRYDAGVLYFDQAHYTTVRQVIQTAYKSCQPYLRERVPLFTKPLIPGLGLAEQPQEQFSASEGFGENRCQILATALLTIHQKGISSFDDRLSVMMQHFAHFRIDLRYPYLNPDSDDIYSPL
jgi:hypothetical protein